MFLIKVLQWEIVLNPDAVNLYKLELVLDFISPTFRITFLTRILFFFLSFFYNKMIVYIYTRSEHIVLKKKPFTDGN